MRTRTKAKGSKLIIGAIILTLLIGGIIGAFTYTTSAVNPKDEEKIVVQIPNGSGTVDIAYILKEQKLIRSIFVFKLYSRLSSSDGKYQAGTYLFTRSKNMREIVSMITGGKTAGKTFQIIEGMTIEKIASQLEKAGIVKEEDFINEATTGVFDYDFLPDIPASTNRLEGYLYPDTYQVPIDADAHKIIDTMLNGYKEAIPQAYYEDAKKQGKNWHEIMTVASIVEREASKAEEKPKVASVIYNRIAISMPLQMDSIISYIHKEDKIRATYKDIEVDSPYNPYKNTGLPPGPICSPGRDAILAAINPSKTKYLYFVAKPALDGTNVYSETYEDFLVNKEAFDKAYEQYIKEHPGEK